MKILPSPKLKVRIKFAPENRPGPKRKQSYSNHPFSGALAVSFREGNSLLIYLCLKMWVVLGISLEVLQNVMNWRWWLFSPPKIGEDRFPSRRTYFFMGGSNHQNSLTSCVWTSSTWLRYHFSSKINVDNVAFFFKSFCIYILDLTITQDAIVANEGWFRDPLLNIYPPRRLTWLAGNSTMNEDVSPIKNGDSSASHVSFQGWYIP